MTIELEHVSGDYFIARGDSLVAPRSVFQEVSTAEFRIGPGGKVVAFGAALEPMMKGEKIVSILSAHLFFFFSLGIWACLGCSLASGLRLHTLKITLKGSNG